MRRSLLLRRFPAHIVIEEPVRDHYLLGASLVPELTDQLFDLRILSVGADTLFYNIQKRKEKLLTGVIDRAKIKLQDTYGIVGPITIDPGEFVISGPDKMIDTLPMEFEIPVERDEINRPFDRKIKLDLFNSDLVTFNPPEIRVSFNVERYISTQIELTVIPVNFPKDSSAYLRDSRLSVSFRVRQSRFDSIRADQFRITADYKKAHRKDSTVIADIEKIPELAEDFEPDTSVLKVIYARRKSR